MHYAVILIVHPVYTWLCSIHLRQPSPISLCDVIVLFEKRFNDYQENGGNIWIAKLLLNAKMSGQEENLTKVFNINVLNDLQKETTK